VYGSNELFQKIWPRSLKSVATEAAGESNAGAAIAEVPAAAVEATLRKAEDGTKTENEVNGAVNVTTTESKENVMFESRAKGETGYLRRSVLTKE
jgi:hypothetical protein